MYAKWLADNCLNYFLLQVLIRFMAIALIKKLLVIVLKIE